MPGTSTAIVPPQAPPVPGAHLGQSSPLPPASAIPAASRISRHDDALGRLEGALAEQDRRRREYRDAAETSLEPDAFLRVCEANERVATRGRWLEWVDQHSDPWRRRAPSATQAPSGGLRS
jgi:hypothetical protein